MLQIPISEKQVDTCW